jgi:hypothetical protein
MEPHYVYWDLSMKSKVDMMVKPMTTVMTVLHYQTHKNVVNLAGCRF